MELQEFVARKKMNPNDFCFECGKVFEDGEAISGSPVDGYCCKGGCAPLKHPICPLNMYWEGDENKCDTSKCNFDTDLRMCLSVCEIKGDKNMGIKIEIGKERKYDTGAKKQHAEGKGMPVLFPGDAYLEVCKHFEDGAVHYGGRNWEKGIPLSSYIDSLERHIAQFKMGLTDESHLRAIAWNAIALLATKIRIEAGILPKELNDINGVYGEK